MEAVPKIPLISFELKGSPEGTNFGPNLKQYIAEAYREDPDSYNNEIHQLEGLRSAAVRPSSDAAGLSSLLRYYCQLRCLQSRFPMAKGQPVACSFSWKDLYSNMSCSQADIHVELASILYNIGALCTQLGASEPRTSQDSMKAAYTNYQHAAWAFQVVREQYPQPQGVDVSTDIMRLLQEICLAQAQECILEKSIQDTRKPSVVGAVATQVLHMYDYSLALLGTSTGTDNIHEIIGTKLYNYWYRYLSFKSSYIGCIVCLYQGMNAEEQQKMGERVAFYQLAVDKLAKARKLAKYVEPVQVTQDALTFTNDVVEGKRKAAKNENEFIYHEEVPDKDLLTELKPVCLVKTLPINLNDPEVSGPDLFSRLVPMVAHEASSVYSEEKAKLLRHVVGQVEAKNTELTEFMSSLQLDQLDVLNTDQKIPQEIVDRCAAMNAKSEVIQILVDSMNNLAEIISDVEHSLSEIKDLIQEETTKEKEYQKVMGPRPPSIVQTELSREYQKYMDAHNRTNESNQVLHKAMTLHIANLRLLAQPLDILQAKIPSIDNIEGLDREAMTEMRRVVTKAREMQTQRDSLVQQLREAINNDDITAQLLARNSDSKEDIFKQELEKHTPTVKIIEQNLAAQENIINKLTSLYASYGESRRLLTDVLRKRDALINALMTSYDTHEELLGKSQKGLDFYKKLSQNMGQLLSRLRSTCQVQGEERAQLLSKNTSKGPASVSSAPSRKPEAVAPSSTSEKAGPKLKDYLPYMKNRSISRSVTPQAQLEHLPADTYYPESIYPTSVRPAPVGSEATDVTQMQMPDGVVTSMMQAPHNPHDPYNRYAAPYMPTETDPYANSIKSYDKPGELNYGTNPNQYQNQMTNPQIYTNPYYAQSFDNSSVIPDQQNPIHYPSNVSQANVSHNINHQYGVYNDPYNIPVNPAQTGTYPDQVSSAPGYNSTVQSEISTNFTQMQISVSKAESYAPPAVGQDYSQNYYNVPYSHTSTPNVQYPQTSTPSTFNYNTGQPSNNLPSQTPSDYGTLYGSDGSQFNQINTNVPSAYSVPDTPQYSYATTIPYDAMSQGYHTYTSADSTISYTPTNVTTTMPSVSSDMPYTSFEPDKIDPIALAQLEAIDKPIISHVIGDAIPSNVSYPNYQSYDTSIHYSNSTNQDPNMAPNPNFVDQTGVNYSQQSYQNHPGYTYNCQTGNYDYAYGSQNSYTSYADPVQGNIDPQPMPKDNNLSAHGVYTSAGACETMQSPSEFPQNNLQNSVDQPSNQQVYYNSPYGYQTVNVMQSNEVTSDSQEVPTNYGAEMNQSTYMQSGQMRDTNVTYSSNNQVSAPTENTPNPETTTEEKQPQTQNATTTAEKSNLPMKEEAEIKGEPEVKKEPEPKPEPTTFDLLSDIDFTVEYTPLVPEIKVPQVSESAIKKPVVMPKSEPRPKPVIKEEVIERPAKRDIFSDPSLLNKFTQEVKELQKLVDSLTNKTPSGLTVLDSKWKTFQEIQANENMVRSKLVARKHTEGSIVAEVVPFDDSRLTLKSDPDVYINASYYKQLASWCIPLVIAKIPAEHEYSTFWRAMLENRINCVVCLLSEIEMQGNSYWPTAIGQCLELAGGVKVTLEEVSCTVHWTERKLNVVCGKTAQQITHYQISVFPAKMVCSPLVLLADKVLRQTFEGRLSNQVAGACVQCAAGAGRSAVLALLTMTMCQLRAGQLALTETLESGLATLCRLRCNVLEDTRYVADAYRAALFYAQGVLCSGTTMFNGEAVSVPTGAAVLPPPPAPASVSPPLGASANKPCKFSRESFEEMKQSPGLKSGDMKDPLNFLDPLWSLKKK